jgi:hypothetical protein
MLQKGRKENWLVEGCNNHQGVDKMATKTKIDAEQLRAVLNSMTDVLSFFKFNVPVDRSGKSLVEDIGETLDISGYLVDMIWEKGVFHKDGYASVDGKDLEELVGLAKHLVDFFIQYLSDGLLGQVEGFLNELNENVGNLKGV